MLSDNDIKRVIKEGKLKIEPFSEDQLKPAAISLHLGFNFLKPISSVTIDPLSDIPEDIYQRISLEENENYVLKPNEFILGETLEKVGISRNLGFLVEGTSTMARLGIEVVQTAMIVDTGVGFPRPRKITLEIKNNGPNPVVLHPKMRIAKALVFRLNTPSSYAYDDKRKYKEQMGVGIPKATKIKGE